MKKRGMKLVVGLLLITMVFLVPGIYAEENEYGTYEAWVKFDGGDWQDVPIEDISLDIYEPFYVKATLTTKIECYVSLSLIGTGVTKKYEVVEGPSEFEETLSCGDEKKPAGWSETYEWKVRPNKEWAGGTSSCRMFAQFTKEIDVEGSDIVDYEYKGDYVNLVHSYISNTIWEGYTEDTDGNDGSDDGNTNNGEDDGNSSPGFELVFVLLALSILYYFKRKTKS